MTQDSRFEQDSKWAEPHLEAIQSLEEAGKKAPKIVGLPSGVDGLDGLFFVAVRSGTKVRKETIGGIPAYGIYNVTGVPDTGKSLFAEQFAVKQAACGRQTIFLTVESPSPFVAAGLRMRAEAMDIDPEVVERGILIVDAATHSELRDELPTLYATLAYAIKQYKVQCTVIDSVTGLYEAREVQARQIVRGLFNFLKKWFQTALFVSQKRSGHEELSAEAAGGYAVAHIVDGTFVFSKKIIESTYDERLYQRPRGEIVRLFRIDGCRLCGHDTETHLLEITDAGLVRIGPPLRLLRERRE